jgi:hypothetical protein
VRAGSTDSTYDWNGDGAVGMDDVNIALEAEQTCSTPQHAEQAIEEQIIREFEGTTIIPNNEHRWPE